MPFQLPNETAQYRSARAILLQKEAELVEQVEQVAELRRALPLGGRLKEDYRFEALRDGEVTSVALSELFAPGKDALLLYALMYGPAMAKACPCCSSLVDGLNAMAPSLNERANLAVVARSPIARIMELACERGWDGLRLLSSEKNTYHPDYGAEDAEGGQLPMMNVFVKRPEGIFHFWGSELLHAGMNKPGRDPRHLDLIWPLWNVLDMTPEGRGTGWYPRLTCADAPCAAP